MQRPVGSAKVGDIISGDGVLPRYDTYVFSKTLQMLDNGTEKLADHLGGFGDKFRMSEKLSYRLMQTNLAFKRKLPSMDSQEGSQAEVSAQNIFSRVIGQIH